MSAPTRVATGSALRPRRAGSDPSAVDGPDPILFVGVSDLPRALVARLEAAGMAVHTASPREDVGALARELRPRLALIDATRAASPARDVVEAIKAAGTCLCSLVVPHPTGAMVRLADESGADTVVTRPLEPVVLRRLLSRAEHARPATSTAPPLWLPRTLAASSQAVREMWRIALLASHGDSSVLLRGETGTGKEVMARVLHRFSARSEGPLVPVNCAALPEGLLESELFGHEKGAFTGATAQHKGRFERAHGGTLFLDEIGELPAELQAKLLRVLQEKTFERVGGTETLSVDVRVIAATHRDIETEVKAGRFRADLFYRLNVISLPVPPLRERKSDILELWAEFLAEIAASEGRPAPATSDAAERLLMRHDWPGNIRELQNAAQHAMMLSTGDMVMPENLPRYLGDRAGTAHGAPSVVGWTMKELERAAILQTHEALGSAKATADMLAISLRKIHYKLKEYRRSDKRAAEIPTVSDAPQRRVLLAEDDDDLRWALARFLTDEGYHVASVEGGAPLLERLGTEMLLGTGGFPFDVIVSDLRMPGLTGLEILERVRARGWNIPVVIISAYGDEDTRRDVERLGAVFLPKPIDPSALQSAITQTQSPA